METEDFEIDEEGCLRSCRREGYRASIPEGITKIGPEAFKDSIVGWVDIPEGVVEIGDKAFSGCIHLRKVDLPDSLTVIGNRVFERCFSLAKIRLPKGLQFLGVNVFSKCRSLNSLNLPASLISIGRMQFENCISLSNITVDPQNPVVVQRSPLLLSRNGTSVLFCSRDAEGSLWIPETVEFIREFAFQGCRKLSEIILPQHLRQVGLCGLNGCTGLTSLHFPKTLSGVSALAMGECTGLREVTLPGTLKFLDCMAFQNCESLTSVDLPGTLTCLGTSTFEGCSSLKRVLLPPNLESLEGKVFSGCRQLKELDFPPSLRTLAEDALDGCTLRRVRFRGEIPDLNPNRLSVEYEGELIADWYPFSGLTEKMKEIVARGVVHRIDKGITITETLRQDVFNWLQENCVSVWRELLFRKFLLSHSLIPLSKYAEIVDLTLEEEDPALTAQVLEYQREHFTDEELGETAWKRYETELDCFRRALCEGQN